MGWWDGPWYRPVESATSMYILVVPRCVVLVGTIYTSVHIVTGRDEKPRYDNVTT